MQRNKTIATAIALFLVLTITATLITLPAANAHTPTWNVPTWAYIAVAPNPVGVDQTATVVFWLDRIPPGAAGIGGDRWRNLKVEVTKPDGTKETLGPFTSDPVGGGWTTYTPDQVGTYSFVFSFLGQVASLTGPTGIPGSANDYINDTFLASSATTTLTVQQEPIPQSPTYPLPTEYWTRPIEGQNTEWYRVASNWLGGSHIVGRVQPDGIAPNSPHIMWTKPISFGGVVGGSQTSVLGTTFYSGLSYEVKFANPIIMYGRLYYNLPLGNNAAGGGYVCVDLRTGEQLWWQNYTTNPSFGQLFDYESMNQHGVIPNGYLWTSNFANAYDPFNGNWLFSMTSVPSGTEVYGPNGEILRYVLNAAGKWLALWNNTAEQQGLHGALGTGTSAYQWRPIGKTVNMSTAYSWNVTIPSLMTGATVVKVIPDDLLLGRNGSLPGNTGNWNPYTMWAISLKPTSRGQLLWMKNYEAPAGNITIQQGPVDQQARVFTMYYKETMQWLGYSIDNGTLLWGPTVSEPYWNFYSSAALSEFITNDNGRLYVGGYSGELRCYDLKNGSLSWIYNNTDSGFATAYDNYPLSIAAVADGKIYVYTSEHSPNAPPYKGVRIRCVNATTGDEIWTVMGWSSGGAGISWAIADGYFVYLNLIDMQIYCFGKGPSATTVSIQNDVITHGNSVLIKGTVTDQSPGSKAKGTPAISDASMGQWMEYLYMQKPIPTNATGVEVTLDTIDPNNNFVHIGTVKSDTSGMFKKMWTPEVPGEYTIIATFAGSKSYYSSYAETAIGVSEAPPAPAAPEPAAAQPPLDMYILYATIAMIIAIAIVGILLLRKRP
jgi:outer membrane protein assembly factor BamB